MTITDHVWLADTSVAISTAEGFIFIVRDNVVQHVRILQIVTHPLSWLYCGNANIPL